MLHREGRPWPTAPTGWTSRCPTARRWSGWGDAPPLPDEAAAVRRALGAPTAGPPLAELLAGRETVAVVFPDLTRPMPNRTVLPPLLAELERLGAGPDRVELLCATGTHRRGHRRRRWPTLVGGPHVVSRYRVHDHRSDDRRPRRGGRGRRTSRSCSTAATSTADVRILTGFVEPHFFAGFSGGPKGVCPGLAATETILEAHSPARIADPPVDLAGHRGQPRPRLRPGGRPRSGPPDSVARRGHQHRVEG